MRASTPVARHATSASFRLTSHELCQSIHGPDLLSDALDLWLEFCQSRRPVTLRHVWRDAWLKYTASSALWLDLPFRRISDCVWSSHASGSFHLQRHNGSGLFHGPCAA